MNIHLPQATKAGPLQHNSTWVNSHCFGIQPRMHGLDPWLPLRKENPGITMFGTNPILDLLLITKVQWDILGP